MRSDDDEIEEKARRRNGTAAAPFVGKWAKSVKRERVLVAVKGIQRVRFGR